MFVLSEQTVISLGYLHIIYSWLPIILRTSRSFYKKHVVFLPNNNKYCWLQNSKEVSCHLLNDSPKVHRFGIFLLKSQPLNNEVIGEVKENLSGQGQVFDSADAFHVDNDHFLYS